MFLLPVAVAGEVATDVDMPLSPRVTPQIHSSVECLSITGGVPPSLVKTLGEREREGEAAHLTLSLSRRLNNRVSFPLHFLKRDAFSFEL